jgi:hypothetical protein
MAQHSGAWLEVHLNEVVHCFQLTNGYLVGRTTDNASTNNLMTSE